MIGFRKDFLPSLHQPEEPSQPTITGSKHSERVLVSNARARSLLLKYAGISKDRKHISCPKQLSEAEFRELCQLTRKDIPSLAAFIKSLRKEHDKKSPPQYRQFISELARCSPACGIFQTRENRQVFEIMHQFLSAQINIFDSASHADLAMLQECVPILAKFLHATTKGGVEIPSDIVSELVTHILDVCWAPYSEPPPTSHQLKVSSVFFHSFLFELGRESMLLTTTCGKTSTLIPAENSPMVILHFPQEYSPYFVLMAYVMVLR